MKMFEVSSKKNRDGRRKFKAVLHEIYSDACVDEAIEAGTQYNDNGITWIREYCQNALPSIKNMFIRVEFADPNERIEILGHGETGIEDGLPIYEDAVDIGHFTDGYIDEIEDEAGNKKVVCIGEGYIDEMCYKRFVSKLTEDMENGYCPFGSVEIYRSENNEGIVYKYGYKERGRIPMEFIYSGYALLGVRPADKTARLLELNSKGDVSVMNEAEIKALIKDTVNEMSNTTTEMNEYKQNCDSQVAAANTERDNAISEKNQAIERADGLQTELDNCRNTITERDNTISELNSKIENLNNELNQIKTEQRLAELNTALEEFSEDQRNYADAEIKAFKENPMTTEINTVTDKIWIGIAKNAKAAADAAEAEAQKVAEQNSASVEDIYGLVETNKQNEDEEISIY